LILELDKFLKHPKVQSRWLTAPASSKIRYHHAHDGGLLVHTLQVFDVLMTLAKSLSTGNPNPGLYEFGPKVSYTVPQFLTCATLHDISKIGDSNGNFYYVPNILKSGKRSDAEPYETNEQMFKYLGATPPNGDPKMAMVTEACHMAEVALEYIPEGEISLAIVRALHPPLFMLLDDQMRSAIRHHDGAYGPGRRFLNGKETPLQMMLHMADMWSSRMAHPEYRA
jgi:hypothetical protein